MRRGVYIVAAIAALALSGCRTRREVRASDDAFKAVSVERIDLGDSLWDTVSLDLQLRLRDVDIRVGDTQVRASAAMVRARAGRRRMQARRVAMADTVAVARRVAQTQEKRSQPARRHSWLATLAVLAACAAAITVYKLKNRQK